MPQGTLTLLGIEIRVVLGVLPVERISGRLAVLEGRTFEYIEELAFAALELLEQRFPPGRWKVTVHKDCPPTVPGSARASVTIGPD